MGFLDEAKREKKEEIRQRKAMQAARRRIHSQYNGMVRKLLVQLGEETWGSRLLGKCHVGKVEKGKEFGLEAGPWGWYVGKGRRGKSSVPYGLGTSAPGEAEVYSVLISLPSGDLPRGRFAVIYGEFGKMRILFTPDLSQAALQEALAEAFRSGPLDLGIFEQGVNAALTTGLLLAEAEETTVQLREAAEDWVKMLKEEISKSSTKGISMTTCLACGSEIRDGVSFCPSCGVPLERGEPVPTGIAQLPSQSSAQLMPQRTPPTASKKKTDSNKLILVAVVAILIIFTICCVCPFTCAVTDTALREIGILPTHTPTATGTPTLTPTMTKTPKPTDTPTPIPIVTSTPIPTDTPLPTPTKTRKLPTSTPVADCDRTDYPRHGWLYDYDLKGEVALWAKPNLPFKNGNTVVSTVPIPIVGGSVLVTVLEECVNDGILFYLVEPGTGARQGYADVDYVYFEKP